MSMQADPVRHPLSLSLRPPQAGGLGDGHFRLLLANAGHGDLAVQLEAADAEHGLEITFEPPLLVVPAGQERYVPLRVHPRFPLPGEEPRVYSFAITACPTGFPDLVVQVHGQWKQLAPFFDLELRPARAAGIVEGLFSVQAANRSLEELTLELAAADPAHSCTFGFQPGEIVVPAGESAPAQLRVRAHAPLPGREAQVHSFTVTAWPQESPQVVRQVSGEWEQTVPAFELHLQSLLPRGATEGVFDLAVHNADKVALTVGLEAADPAGECLFTLMPPLVVVPAGQVRPARVRVQPRAPLHTAEARPHPFTLTARPAEAPGWTCQVQGEWVQLPAPTPAVRTWGPLVLLLFGWALAGGIAAASYPFLSGGNSVLGLLLLWGVLLGLPASLATVLVATALAGLVAGLGGGLVTALAARWAEPTLHWRSVWSIFFGWAFCQLVGGAALAAIQYLPGDVWRSLPLVTVHGAVVGLAGGVVTGLALRRALPHVRPLLVALGWAATWGLGEALLSLSYLDLCNRLMPVLAGLPDPDHAGALVALVVLGAAVGLGGGITTLVWIARARRALALPPSTGEKSDRSPDLSHVPR